MDNKCKKIRVSAPVNMKNLLFIVPSRANCGTNSSFSAIYNILRHQYKIDILTIKSSGNGIYEFLKHSFTSNILEAYYGNFKDLKGKTKILSVCLKIFKHISYAIHINGDDTVNRYAARKIERKKQYDFIIGFQEGLAMRVASNFSNLNKLTWLHCDYERAVSPDTNELKYYDKFNNIVCVSNFTKEKFISRYPSLENRTCCIYNLIDIDKVLQLSAEPVADLKFRNDCYTIISAGRMDPVKQFSKIPNIARIIADKGYKFRWYILGGPENEEFRKIKMEIRKYDAEDMVILLGNKRNPYPYFKASHLYVSTSLSEACPMVFNEAKICGIPIVSSNFGSAVEFVNSKVDGLIGSLTDLPNLIIAIMTDETYHKVSDMNTEAILNQNNAIKCKLTSLFA